MSGDRYREAADKVRQFLAGYCRNQEIADDDDVFAMGFVSSLVATQLVLFVEKEFSIRVDNDDLDLANFRSINAIASLIARKQGAVA